MSYWWWWLLLIPILVPAGILFLMFLVSMIDGAETSSLTSMAKLECYHCGQETNSTHKTCQHCGGELQ